MNSLRLLIIVNLLLITSIQLKSQELKRVIIEPERVGILNDVINNDTLPDGSRDPNTVYVLLRNGIYKTTGEIQNPGFHLRIEAEKGPGAMPM